MINKTKYDYKVTSYQELINLCSQIRNRYKKKKFTILIDDDKEEIGNYKFPFSNFHIINKNHILSSNLYAKMKDENGDELTTWKTAALKITGSNNIFENLIVKNIAGDSEIKGQEVALAVYGSNNLFNRVYLESMQDTLFVGPLPDDLSTRYIDFLDEDERYYEGNSINYFNNSEIKGSIDFIFGAGKAIFNKCNLVTVKDKRRESYVVAPSHSLKDDFGYFFNECHFKHDKNVDENSTFLARPWRDYGKAVFNNCIYSKHINPLLFHDWSDVNRIRTCRFLSFPYKKGSVSWMKNKEKDALPAYYLTELRKLINFINININVI